MNGKEAADGVEDAILFVEWRWASGGLAEAASGWCRLGTFLAAKRSPSVWEKIVALCKMTAADRVLDENSLGAEIGFLLAQGFEASSRAGLTPLSSYPQMVLGVAPSSWILALRIECRQEPLGDARAKAAAARQELFAGEPMVCSETGGWSALNAVMAPRLSVVERSWMERRELSVLLADADCAERRGRL